MMRRWLDIKRHSLVVQMVLSYMALVFVIGAAAGLPAGLLINSQIGRQAWAQVSQGSQATEALYVAWQSKVIDLAMLTAQRPTLHRLLAQEDAARLSEYLETLQQGTDLDVLLVCNASGRLVADSGVPASLAACDAEEPVGYVFSTEASPRVWFLVGHTIVDQTDVLGQVIVGVALNDTFASQMKAQTGLEHTIWLGEELVSSSLPDGVAAGNRRTYRTESSSSAGMAARVKFYLDGRSYYAARLPLDGNGLVDEVALDVSDIAMTQDRLIWTLVGSIALVTLVGSLLGIAAARRIGRPLARLAAAATSLSTGDLGTTVKVQPQVREVDQVARALEQARIDLQQSLTELRQAKAWTDHLLEAIVEGIVTLDERGRITFFSPGAERITGWSQAEVLNRSCDNVFRPTETTEPFSSFIPAPGRQSRVALALADGRQATLAITGARLTPPDAGGVGVALVFRDVSESELIHRLLGEFLANITHEFRTPLSAVAASTELLLDQAPDLSPAELQELLASLHVGIAGLQTLIDNLLESASLETGRFRVYPRPSDLGEIIAEATGTMRPLQEKYGQRLVVELPATIPVVHADPRRIVQVLVNLLSNAIKYSPDESEIALGVTVNEGWVQVTVADRGPGVPSGYRPDLFRRFVYSRSAPTRASRGAGLGLSVVKAVVEAHGGQVGAEDRPGGGALFWFRLPMEKKG